MHTNKLFKLILFRTQRFSMTIKVIDFTYLRGTKKKKIFSSFFRRITAFVSIFPRLLRETGSSTHVFVRVRSKVARFESCGWPGEDSRKWVSNRVIKNLNYRLPLIAANEAIANNSPVKNLPPSSPPRFLTDSLSYCKLNSNLITLLFARGKKKKKIRRENIRGKIRRFTDLYNLPELF